MSLAFIACWSPENKFRAPLKRMLEANLMNVILATEQQGLKKLMIHFLETL